MIFRKIIVWVSLLLSLNVFPSTLALAICDKYPDIVIVGGGPTGLDTAIQVKLMSPQAKICVLEKYENYQRTHTVFVDAEKSFGNATETKSFKQKATKEFNGSIPTTNIENSFLTQAKDLGIEIEYQNITDVKQIKTQFPNVKFVVGADGSHSVFRKTLFKDVAKPQKNLQYLVEVKYMVDGKSRKLSSFEYLKNIRHANHMIVSERVGKATLIDAAKAISDEADGEVENEAEPNTPPAQLPVAFGAIVNKKEFEALQGAGVSFKDPLIFDEQSKGRSPLSPELYDTIATWLKDRKKATCEKVIPGSIKVTAIPLVEYYTLDPYKKIDGVHYTIVGDAAFAVPYFVGINNGFASANVLAKVLAQQLMKYKLCHSKVHDPRFTNTIVGKTVSSVTGLYKMHQNSFQDYTNYVNALETREGTLAHLKNFAVNLAKFGTKTAQTLYKTRKAIERVASSVARAIFRPLLSSSSGPRPAPKTPPVPVVPAVPAESAPAVPGIAPATDPATTPIPATHAVP